MRKILSILGFLAFLAAGASCNKEAPGHDIDEGKAQQEALCTVRFSLNMDGAGTKAVDIGSLADGGITRIDVFEYDSSSMPTQHISLTADELESKSFHLQQKYGTIRSYLVLANLPEELAGQIAALSIAQMKRQRFRWADLFDGTHIPIGGTAYVSYNSDMTVSIPLRRYMYRVDVGQVKVDFDDETWMGKDVFVKNIALINVPAAPFLMCVNYSYQLASPLTALFGNALTIKEDEPIFGNLDAGYAGWEVANIDATGSCLLPDGSSVSIKRNMNFNMEKSPGVLYLNAEGALRTATVQTYDTGAGEGRVCSSTDASQSHTLNVGKSFYAWAGCNTYGQYPLLTIYIYQNAYPKLVIELSVDGQSYFYPIQMYYPQPNTVYTIDRITLRSMGSDYSNFYEKQFGMDVSLSVSEWNDVEIENIDAGYSDDHKTEIY